MGAATWRLQIDDSVGPIVEVDQSTSKKILRLLNLKQQAPGRENLQVRVVRSASVMVVLVAVLVIFLASTNAPTMTSAKSQNASSSQPGVTRTSINVGALATLSGPLAADFAAIVPGVRAYFSYVNARGGVNGRSVNLTHVVDDGGVPSNNANGARTLVQQDKVFAVVGMASFFFTAEPYLAQTGTPTFGYATQNDWAGPLNLFGAYGSVINNDTAGPAFAFIAERTHAHSIGLMAYGVPQSAGVCQVAERELRKVGFHIGFVDLNAPLGGDLTPDALRMKKANVDLLMSCMDVNGNVQIARAMYQNGMSNFSQFWLDGYNSSTLKQYSSIMKKTYFMVQHVPFQAPAEFPGGFPGVATYLAAMKKYAPQDVQSEVAMEGWISAATFVEGLRAAGPNPTQAAVVKEINKLPNFTADEVMSPVAWTVSHTKVLEPSCESYVETGMTGHGTPNFHVVFNKGTNIWVCFNYQGPLDVHHPVPPPKGAPGT